MVRGKLKEVLKPITVRREVWQSTMKQGYPILAGIAVRLLSLHATSCSAERNWSRWRFTMRDNRKSLSVTKVYQLFYMQCTLSCDLTGLT